MKHRVKVTVLDRCSMKIFNKNIVKILAQENVLFTTKAMFLSFIVKTVGTAFGSAV